MITKEEANDKVRELVKEFSAFTQDELGSKSENQIKSEFIDPLFEALGWNMRKDAEREEKILKGRADYILRIGNEEVTIIEAKKTNVILSEDEGRQTVSYAYHRKVKFSVLTNFKYVRVYHALSNTKNIDKNLLFWIEFKDFEKDFDKLWLLSKESFEKKDINKLLSKKDEKKFIAVDESILADLLEIRRLLSNDLKKLRMYLSDEKIDESIQILIDRLIFIRSAEDRGLENKNFLLGLVKDSREGRLKNKLWYALQEYFKNFDDNYNSKLFTPGILEDERNVFFDDSTLEKIIRTLYFGKKEQQSRYMFDEIPGDLLGSIYEQYLGVVLRGTEKRVTLSGETGKRKKMGIYYTPSYIVDYIVKNTVGEYTKDKTIDEILEVNIVDPACGSGSFLIRAFQELCDIIEGKLKSGEKAKNPTFKNYENRLNLAQKITILTRCIHGVDLDEKAVELAQLNLLLKLLEGETRETRKQLLPNLKNNIKNGNSLIDDSKVAGDKAFNWNAQFPDVFRNGGFDVVIGNPPWGQKSVKFSENEKEYLKINYPTSVLGQLDIFRFFIEKTIRLISKNGFFAFVLPDIILLKDYPSTRKLILDSLRIIKMDIWGMAFENVNLDSCTIIGVKNKIKDNIIEVTIHTNKEAIKNEIPQSNFDRMDGYKFNLYLNDSAANLINKLKKNGNFGDFFESHEGIHSGNIRDKLFVDKKLDSHSKKLIFGRGEVKRYHLKWAGKYVNYNSSIINKKGGEYAGLGRLEYFENKKIVVRRTGDYILASLDEENYYFSNNVFVCLPREGKIIDLKYVLAILNSKLSTWFYRTIQPRKGKLFAELKINVLKQLPIRLPLSKSQEKKIAYLVDEMLQLQKRFHGEEISGNGREAIERQIVNIDYEIDQEVYKLYELTKDEIEIIERSLEDGKD